MDNENKFWNSKEGELIKRIQKEQKELRKDIDELQELSKIVKENAENLICTRAINAASDKLKYNMFMAATDKVTYITLKPEYQNP